MTRARKWDIKNIDPGACDDCAGVDLMKFHMKKNERSTSVNIFYTLFDKKY